MLMTSIVIEVKNSQMPVTQNVHVEIKYGAFLYEEARRSYTLQSMSLEAESTLVGMLGEIGVLTVRLTQAPNGNFTLVYEGEATVLEGVQCENCTARSLTLRGKVKYFQHSTLTLKAISTLANGTSIIYAQGQTTVSYPCSSTPGCQKCFPKSLTPLYLMYQQRCVTACPIMTYPDNEITCLNCSENCYNCTNAG